MFFRQFLKQKNLHHSLGLLKGTSTIEHISLIENEGIDKQRKILCFVEMKSEKTIL